MGRRRAGALVVLAASFCALMFGVLRHRQEDLRLRSSELNDVRQAWGRIADTRPAPEADAETGFLNDLSLHANDSASALQTFRRSFESMGMTVKSAAISTVTPASATLAAQRISLQVHGSYIPLKVGLSALLAGSSSSERLLLHSLQIQTAPSGAQVEARIELLALARPPGMAMKGAAR